MCVCVCTQQSCDTLSLGSDIVRTSTFPLRAARLAEPVANGAACAVRGTEGVPIFRWLRLVHHISTMLVVLVVAAMIGGVAVPEAVAAGMRMEIR